MKVAILAGGAGTRLAEETVVRPKPMVEIGGRPILWHIMQHYRHFGFHEFVIALGYKGECIRDFFVNECASPGHLRVDFGSATATSPPNNGTRNGHRNGNGASHLPGSKPPVIDLVETGDKTATGGRIKRLAPWLENDTFMLTWGDGVSDVDLKALLTFHRSHGKLATVTAVHPPGRFGCLDIRDGAVSRFEEKPADTREWINGAFFVLEPTVLDYIDDDSTQWEEGPMERLAAEGQLMAWQHESFWQCMDTLKEKELLQSLWDHGNAPWKCWK
ncbi:MAG: glucose-1-phosphate cytidylyltransferase [Planctomycetes bacterium]|nr:glucose-1-phosphate cytidylyltransferase [Planctomycetota bacterium]